MPIMTNHVVTVYPAAASDVEQVALNTIPLDPVLLGDSTLDSQHLKQYLKALDGSDCVFLGAYKKSLIGVLYLKVNGFTTIPTQNDWPDSLKRRCRCLPVPYVDTPTALSLIMPKDKASALKDATIADIAYLGVLPEHQGQGVATELLQGAKKYLESKYSPSIIRCDSTNEFLTRACISAFNSTVVTELPYDDSFIAQIGRAHV